MALLALLSLAWSWPLPLHLADRLPGAGLGDNLQFVWNLWWMRQALADPELEFFRTTHLFYPEGMDLTLHTHTALPALVAATALAPLPPVAALNVLLLASLFGNALGAYLLAHHVCGRRSAALLAGALYGGSPYFAGRLLGHFNLVFAWGLPLFALFWLAALRRRCPMRAALAGLTAVAVAYTDYYYAVYLALLAGLLLVTGWLALERRAGGEAPSAACLRRLERALLALLALALALIAMVALTGGFAARIGPLELSARHTFGLRTAAGLFASGWLALRAGRRFALKRRGGAMPLADLRLAGLLLAVFLAGAAPLLARGAALAARGEYVSQSYVWRHAPRGVDLGTLVLGNPFHGLLGEAASSLERRLGIDRMEQTGWLGIVAPLVVILGRRRRAERAESDRWTAIAGAFFLWALGPWLWLFGWNSGIALPQALARFVPLVANARIPGRAMAVVWLALAVLLALAVAELRRRGAGAGVVALLLVGVLAEGLAAPLPLAEPAVPALYERLGALARPGAVCELPLGLADGFGVTGRFDARVLLNQTVHRRPIVGGYVSRLPRRRIEELRATPVLGDLLRLSAGERPARPAAPGRRRRARRALERLGVVYFVLDRRRASPALAAYFERALPLERIDAAPDGRELYELGGAGRASGR